VASGEENKEQERFLATWAGAGAWKESTMNRPPTRAGKNEGRENRGGKNRGEKREAGKTGGGKNRGGRRGACWLGNGVVSLDSGPWRISFY
jgi:hypothetical protein